VPSGRETGYWKVHRFSRARRFEILAQKYDLPASGTQEDHVILAIVSLQEISGDCGHAI